MGDIRVGALLGVACCCLLGMARAEEVRVADEGGIRDAWMLADGAGISAPGYPGPFVARGDNVCVALGYRVNSDGTTSDFTLLRSWASSTGEAEPDAGFWNAFAQASAAAVSQWRFQPREGVVARPVDTVASMVFMGSRPEDPSALRAHCRIPDLRAFLEESRNGSGKRRDLNQVQLESALRQQARNEMKALQRQRGHLMDEDQIQH